jgi:hypothetical protein
MSFAFSMSSSSATIPVTLNTLETRLGVRNSVAAFTVPLGATINMDGTAIMQGVATVFIANVYGIDLLLADYLTVILTATLASIGTAAVPSAGLSMLAMVLGQVGLPVEGIALIIGIDRLLDMLRTAVNVAGDGAVTCVVAQSEVHLCPVQPVAPRVVGDPGHRRILRAGLDSTHADRRVDDRGAPRRGAVPATRRPEGGRRSDPRGSTGPGAAALRRTEHHDDRLRRDGLAHRA